MFLIINCTLFYISYSICFQSNLCYLISSKTGFKRSITDFDIRVKIVIHLVCWIDFIPFKAKITLTPHIIWICQIKFHDVICNEVFSNHFRCRADFHIAPTRKYVVVLDIIEPPEKPYIIDQAVKKIITNKLGPYRLVDR